MWALLALLGPWSYPHTLLPLVPPDMYGLVAAPTPFLLGVPSLECVDEFLSEAPLVSILDCNVPAGCFTEGRGQAAKFEETCCTVGDALCFMGRPNLDTRLAPAAARIWQARRGSGANDIQAEGVGVQELMHELLVFHSELQELMVCLATAPIPAGDGETSATGTNKITSAFATQFAMSLLWQNSDACLGIAQTQ